MKKSLIHILPFLLVIGLFLLNSCKTSKAPGTSGKANTKALDEFVASMQEQEVPHLVCPVEHRFEYSR